MKLPLTAETVAAILAGATEIEVDVEVPGQGEQTQAGATGAETETPAAAAAAASTPPATPAASTETPAAGAPAGAASELVGFLKDQLSTAQASLTAAQVEIAQLKAGAPDQAVQNGLLAIARSALGNVQVALGGTSTAEAMDAKAVVAEHARVMPLFAKKFPVGGVSAASTTETKPAAPAFDPEYQRRLAACS